MVNVAVAGCPNYPKEARGVLEFRCRTKRPDTGDVCDQRFYGKSELVVSEYAYPLKFFFPNKISSGPCSWVYPVQFGGGLVPGDQYHFDVTVGPHSCVMYASQSSTKVFSPTATSKGCAILTGKWNVHDHGFLSVLPDAVVPHRASSLKQVQEIRLGPEGNIIFLDWFTGGRIASQELWEFQLLQSTVHLYCNGALILRESTKLSETSVSVKQSMGPYNAYGTCIIFGPRLKELSADISNRIEQQRLLPKNRPEKFLVTSSPLYSDRQSRAGENPKGCILRFCSVSTSDVYQFLQDTLSPMFQLYGANPFHLK